MRCLTYIPIACFFLFVIQSLHARIIHVPGDQPTIQQGIGAASDGDTVLVADGTYTGDGNRDIDFLGKAIVVMSENGYESTIIDCQSAGRGFYFHSGEEASSILKGFTITNGHSLPGSDQGAGIFCNGSSPYILKCHFLRNRNTQYGGGMACDNNSSPIIEECVFSENYARTHAGGIHSQYSNPTIIRCVFSQNGFKQEDVTRTGGAMRIAEGSPLISECIVIGNIADVGGGGIECIQNGNPVIVDCIFSNNIVTLNNYGGGSILIASSSPQVTGCVIVGNSAFEGGAILSKNFSGPTFINCTLAHNQATGGQGGGVHVKDSSSVYITNSILWENVPNEIQIMNADSVVVTFSDIQGGWKGTGNINQNPLFIGGEPYNYYLQIDSPCIDMGDSTILDACRPPGLGEERSDMGAYGGEENCGWPILIDPTIISTPDTLAIAGLEYYYDVEAYDPTGDTLCFSLQVAPSWLSIDSITGIIYGVPPISAIGDTTVTVLVEDGHGGSDDQIYPLIVLPQVDLIIIPDGPTSIPTGEILYFNTYIQNYRENTVEGDYWLSALLPDSNEVFIPGSLLNYSNPLHGQVFGNSFIDLSNQLFVPTQADTGSYQLIGRIGQHPNTIIDEESFGFRVVE